MRFVWMLLAVPVLAQRQMAITIDDLPCAGACGGLAEAQRITRQITTALKGIPAIGFVNEHQLQRDGERDARVALLRQWLDAGLQLGNHTYAHLNPDNVPVTEYEDDIIRGEVVLRELLEGRPKQRLFFRHPFTHTGPTAEYKSEVERFLNTHGYTIAPVTVDNSDYIYAHIYRDAQKRGDAVAAKRIREEYLAHWRKAVPYMESASVRLFGREIPQTLLMHASTLNGDLMPEILLIMRERGYVFVPLEKALDDAAYRTPDVYVAQYGPSWFGR